MADTDTDTKNGVAVERPAGDSGWFLAVGSTRIRGHRFKWGQELPSPEGAKYGDRGYAVDDAGKLRGRDGSPLPPPSLRKVLDDSPHPAAHDTGATVPGESTVETTSSDGVRAEGSTSESAGATPVNDSQSGSTRRVRAK